MKNKEIDKIFNEDIELELLYEGFIDNYKKKKKEKNDAKLKAELDTLRKKEIEDLNDLVDYGNDTKAVFKESDYDYTNEIKLFNELTKRSMTILKKHGFPVENIKFKTEISELNIDRKYKTIYCYKLRYTLVDCDAPNFEKFRDKLEDDDFKATDDVIKDLSKIGLATTEDQYDCLTVNPKIFSKFPFLKNGGYFSFNDGHGFDSGVYFFKLKTLEEYKQTKQA